LAFSPLSSFPNSNQYLALPNGIFHSKLFAECAKKSTCFSADALIIGAVTNVVLSDHLAFIGTVRLFVAIIFRKQHTLKIYRTTQHNQTHMTVLNSSGERWCVEDDQYPRRCQLAALGAAD
jgi:hypothetical protein